MHMVPVTIQKATCLGRRYENSKRHGHRATINIRTALLAPLQYSKAALHTVLRCLLYGTVLLSCMLHCNHPSLYPVVQYSSYRRSLSTPHPLKYMNSKKRSRVRNHCFLLPDRATASCTSGGSVLGVELCISVRRCGMSLWSNFRTEMYLDHD